MGWSGEACVGSIRSGPSAHRGFQVVVLSKVQAKGLQPGLPAAHPLHPGMAGFLASCHGRLCK